MVYLLQFVVEKEGNNLHAKVRTGNKKWECMTEATSYKDANLQSALTPFLFFLLFSSLCSVVHVEY